MSVYLYNLGFSLLTSDTGVGRFQQYDSSIRNPSIASQSAAWFTYNQSGTPNNMGDWYQAVLTQLDPSQWTFYASDANALNMNPGDYLIMRMFCADANVASYSARVTGVFGRGASQVLAPGAGDLQSPLCMNSQGGPSTTYPRAVIDADGSTASNWPRPVTGPLTADGSWINWLGMVHISPTNAANDYTCNVGVTVFNGTQVYTFGKDPRMHVGGMAKRGERAA